MKRYIETQNLILRGWNKRDISDLAQLNCNERVMEFFLKKLTYDESANFYNKICQEFHTYGYGLYAVEEKATNLFIGYVGFHNITFEIDFSPAVEIGWRLLPQFWGKGYATEAAIACLEYAKNELKLNKIYSFTSLLNEKSERVMKRIGMDKVKEFNHPMVDVTNPLCRHVLYKIEL